MSGLPDLSIVAQDLDALATFEGRIVLFAADSEQMDVATRRANRLTRGAVKRALEGDGFVKAKAGQAIELAYPAGMAAEALMIVRLDKKASGEVARRAGAGVAAKAGGAALMVCATSVAHRIELVLGIMLRSYYFGTCKSGPKEGEDDPAVKKVLTSLTVMLAKPEGVEERLTRALALAEGVHFTRDLVNLPANVLTTTNFAERLVELRDLGLEVEVLEEDALEEIGMRMLLGVGQGSETPTKVVVMQWKGGPADQAPLALIGKGVVFDTGGISLKPGGGMEDMTMDMGGAGTVAGVMKSIALRKAKANVVGLVGLVENMPDGKAQRPGDIVTSLKGDTVEIINTDAEGRLVLGDVMWYAAERFKPTGMIDLATLTGAIIVAIGHENAGVFSNDDGFCNTFLKAAKAEGEGAWRMPLGSGYAKLLDSAKADMRNVGTRAAGAVTAAEFLKCFVPEGLPWIHLDIAGVAQPAKPTPFAPAGASGWGVMALDRLVLDQYETD